jgi:DNA polymerase-2
MRGSARGSKKRYAGLLREPDGAGGWRERLVFRGLESVRTDWTPLAREVQHALYLRVFRGEPFETYVRDVADQVLGGQRDRDLLYRKRLRRGIGEYQRNVPPHAQAAAKADRIRVGRGLPAMYDRGGWVEYYITTAGPEHARYHTSPLDYEHYLARQLAPVVDGIAGFLDTSFDEIVGRQLGLFAGIKG